MSSKDSKTDVKKFQLSKLRKRKFVSECLLCRHPGCHKYAQREGLCWVHGVTAPCRGKVFDLATKTVVPCPKRVVQSRDYCRFHGGELPFRCIKAGCCFPAEYEGGGCSLHTAGAETVKEDPSPEAPRPYTRKCRHCQFLCATPADRYCYRHGGSDKCIRKGCYYRQLQGAEYCRWHLHNPSAMPKGLLLRCNGDRRCEFAVPGEDGPIHCNRLIVKAKEKYCWLHTEHADKCLVPGCCDMVFFNDGEGTTFCYNHGRMPCCHENCSKLSIRQSPYCDQHGGGRCLFCNERMSSVEGFCADHIELAKAEGLIGKTKQRLALVDLPPRGSNAKKLRPDFCSQTIITTSTLASVSDLLSRR